MRPLTRRGLLTSTLGAGVLGAALGAGVDEGVHAAGHRAGASTPGESLMTEHGVLKRVLLVYRATDTAAWTAGTTAAVHTCATVIHDYIEGFHEALEEGYVFPRLTAAKMQTATIETLLLQHGRGRQLTAAILAATAGAVPSSSAATELRSHLAAFVRMYEVHEAREDTEIFPALRALLGDEGCADLGATFTTLEHRQFGEGSLAKVLTAVRSAESACGIEDLASFTPAPVGAGS